MFTLIPTPLQDDLPLEPKAKEFLLSFKGRILIEEKKTAIRRWIQWGLPREGIEQFELLNEHTENQSIDFLIKDAKSNDFALLSDLGLPCFCDPGQKLILKLRENKIPINMTPFPNSSLTALVLSGFKSEPHLTWGFLPKEEKKAKELIESTSTTQVFLERPYRLKQTLQFLNFFKRRVFIAIDCFSKNEIHLFGKIEEIQIQEIKAPFVVVLEGK